MFITSILVVSGLVLTGVFIAALSSVIRDSEMDKKVKELKDIIDSRFNQINKRLDKIENNK